MRPSTERPREAVWQDCLYSRAIWHRHEPTGAAAIDAMCREFLERFPEVKIDGDEMDEDFDVVAVREFCETILAKLHTDGGGNGIAEGCSF
jgi:hypothetical protein